MYSGGFFLARRALIGLNIEGLIQDVQEMCTMRMAAMSTGTSTYVGHTLN